MFASDFRLLLFKPFIKYKNKIHINLIPRAGFASQSVNDTIYLFEGYSGWSMTVIVSWSVIVIVSLPGAIENYFI